jgi:hypothetical protein
MDLIFSGFDLEVEVVVRAVCKGFHIGWVPIRTIYGTGKASYLHLFHDTQRFLGMVWNAIRYRKNLSGILGT